MPEVQAFTVSQAATLELEQSAHLSGTVSQWREAGLDLSSVKVLRGSQTSGKISLVAGTPGTLQFEGLFDDEGALPPLEVSVRNAAGTTLQLEFMAGQQAIVDRISRALGFDTSDDTGDDTAPEPPPLPKTGRGVDQNALDYLRESADKELGTRYRQFLVKLTDHLFDLSNIEGTASGYNRHYEVMNLVKRGSDDIAAHFLRLIDEGFDRLLQQDPNRNDSDATDADTDLNLVDLNEFEDHLAIAKIIKTGENLHGPALECLTLRLAEIVDQPPELVRLPIHVAPICRAMRDSLSSLEIATDIVVEVQDLFVEAILRELGDYYEQENRTLKKLGFAPNVEEEIKRHGSILKRRKEEPKRKPPSEPPADTNEPTTEAPQETTAPATETAAPASGSATGAPATTAAPAAGGGAPGGSLNPDSLYQSVIDALNFRREAESLQARGVPLDESTGAAASGFSGEEGSTATAAADTNTNPADAAAIAQALNALQRDQQARASLNTQGSLREYLAKNQASMSGLEGTTGLAADTLNQIDLVDNLFGSIQSQLDVTAELRPALGDLQIPLARLALLEPQFFLNRDHPARGVIDALALLSNSANYPNKALENRVQGIVDDIVTNYDSDSDIFDRALQQVDRLVNQQERALARNVERVVKTEDGQQRLQKAQLAVNRIVRTRIRPPAAPTVLVDLIESGWRDLLVLTHIKQGPESKGWKDQVKSLDLLSLWLIEQQKGDLDEEILVQRQLEAEPFIDMLQQQISSALPTNVAHVEVLQTLRDVLAGRLPIATTRISDTEGAPQPKPEEIRAKIDTLPRLRRWVRRVEQLELGTWLNYKNREGHKRRMQLAWVSEEKDRYIFVNERGQKNADLTSVQLARQLSKGVRPPPPSDQMSLVDQSMYTTLEHVQKSLSFANNHDSLTKLINRETFESQVDRALLHAQRRQSQHALMFLDIDQFELVNDVYDTSTGDLVLTEFARLLAQLHGKKTSSARLQDDEFGVLMLDRDPEQAVAAADRIRSDINASSVDVDGEKILFSVSIGVAPILPHSPPVPDLLEHAETAMRLAKSAGRNSVALFTEDQREIEEQKRQQAATIAELEHTIETDRFILRAQPIVQTSVDDGAPVANHFEILLGLKNSDGTLSSPQEFILAAERYGYMTQVDRWVVRETFSWISHLMDAQKEVPYLSINISGNSVTDDAFMEFLLEQISDWGVGTSKLCFEITETGTITNLVKAADFVRAFRNIGCRFSLDDFGTGLASHNYLRELPVDYVKIDGTFITNISENRNDYAMARSINDLAHFLGQKTIAESVENEAIRDVLKEIGVDYLQGWGVGKPRPLDEITEELSSLEK